MTFRDAGVGDVVFSKGLVRGRAEDEEMKCMRCVVKTWRRHGVCLRRHNVCVLVLL